MTSRILAGKMKGIGSAVIVTLIVVVSTIAVINVLNPFIREGTTYQHFNEARQVARSISSTVGQLLLEAPGSKRTINVNLPSGRLIVSDSDDSIKIRLDDAKDIISSGFTTKEGAVEIKGGALMRAYESDIDGDGSADLVMENNAVIFAVKKLGSSSQYAPINMSNATTLMRNKRLNVNVTPSAGIFINDIKATSYGNGYTKMSPVGENIESSAISVFMNSSAGIVYEAQFSLAAAQDFVDLNIKRIEGV